MQMRLELLRFCRAQCVAALRYNMRMVPQDAITVNGQPLNHLRLVADDLYEWQPVEITCLPQPNVITAALQMGELELGPPTTTFGDPRWRWRWHPQHAVGRFEARLTLAYADGRVERELFQLRIVPRKLALEQYEALIAALQRDVHEIVYALSGGREGAGLIRTGGVQRSLIEEYVTLVEQHAVEAVALTKRIAARPQQTLATQATSLSLAEAQRVDLAALADLARGPVDEVFEDVAPALQMALRRSDQTQGGPLPRTVRGVHSVTTVDTLEHRVLKHVLELLMWRVEFVRGMIRREVQRRQRNAQIVESGAALTALESWQQRCATALRSLRHMLATPWLSEVGVLRAPVGPTHLMRREPRYRRLYRLYQALRSTPFLAFDSPLLWLPLQELPTLYEQWCTVQVIKALLPLGTVVTQTLVNRDDAARTEPRWMLRLRQNTPLLTLQLSNETELVVCYQRRYQARAGLEQTLGALDPFVRIPDIALEFRTKNGPPRVLIFDAKYRVAPDGGVPQDALDDAYAYRSAIGYAGTRATYGAFLLFPGDTPLMTADQVGAVPLLPDHSEPLVALMRQALAA